MKAQPALVLLVLFSASPTVRGEEAHDQILAFARAWLNPQDYAWSRESLTRPRKGSDEAVSIKDWGRVRVEFVAAAEESVELNPHILKYEYTTQIPGDEPHSTVSNLEGQKLPPVWLHTVLGYSVGVSPDMQLQLGNSHQAAEVLDLLDFRGFVPDVMPIPGKEWTMRAERRPEGAFNFREETIRQFRCTRVEPGGAEGSRCHVEFTETVKLTSLDPKRTSELRERKGTFSLTMPLGLIEDATWETTATEYFKSGASRSQIETVTKVSLVRRDVPGSKSKNAPPDSARTTELPRPPR